jgi:thymidylate synthase
MSFNYFTGAIRFAIENLDELGSVVDSGKWQGISTKGKPDLVTREVLNLKVEVNLERDAWYNGSMDDYVKQLADEIRPNLPWADEHFEERVGGIPRNPDPSHTKWPWWHGQDDDTKANGQFTHTYSERFWPKQAGSPVWKDDGLTRPGIRFPYGDYNDLLDLLTREPMTRQAYLPIFFPEDTGAVHGGRIPCSLGYHFLLRDLQLHCWYEIRSCDAVRHFRDDLYLASRLVAHTIERLAAAGNWEDIWNRVDPGVLYFNAHSFHVHMGDRHRLETY